jgi:hypothetical protein
MMMQEKYLKAKEAIKYANISKSTLRRRLAEELKRNGLKWEDSPGLVKERTSNIIKILEGKDEHGQELHHWRYSTDFLTMVKEGVHIKADYAHRKVDYSQRSFDHSQESSEYGQGGAQEESRANAENKRQNNFKKSADHGQEPSDHSQKSFNNQMNMGQNPVPDYSQIKNEFPDHGQDYVQVNKDYLDMLKDEYRAKKKLEEDYRNKDNQINLIIQNLSKAMETLKERIKVLEAPKDKDYYSKENYKNNDAHEIGDLKEEKYE